MFPPQILFFLVLVISLFHSISGLSQNEHQRYKQILDGQGLYSMEDDVIILTSTNFKSQVLNSSSGWYVEFYNSWCGFCQRFAPSWKALATDIISWGDLVKVAALDCSQDENTPICREYEVMVYPTLRYFHENYQEGLGRAIKKGDDVSSHRQNLLEEILTEKQSGRGKQFPISQQFIGGDVNELFHTKSQIGFLVVESNGLLGIGAALDFHRIPNVRIHYSFDNNTRLITNYGIEKTPVIIAINQRKNYRILNCKDTRESVRQVITNYLKENDISVTVAPPHGDIYTGKWQEADAPDMSELIQERTRQALRKRIKLMGDVVFQMDLETTLRYSLKHEILTNKIIEGEKLEVLRAYFKLLQKYFPFGANGQLFLNELTVAASSVNTLLTSNLGTIINRAELESSRVFSTPQQFLACRGSTTSYRGYPCGLWKLFHFLTVNSISTDPLEVLSVMHGYIKHFFGCYDCSQHFQEMARERQIQNVTSGDSAILWLWMAHNLVNRRLSGDSTEDPDFPKVQFPKRENCRECRTDDQKWDLNAVLSYLKHVYSSVNVRYIGSDTTVLHFDLPNLDSSNYDISMCFVLYVCSFILLAILIRIFLKRGYRKKRYVHDLLGKV